MRRRAPLGPLPLAFLSALLLARWAAVLPAHAADREPLPPVPGVTPPETPETPETPGPPEPPETPPPPEPPVPTVTVYTMGPGAELFSRFGHAAICVTDEITPQGRCYNYGTTDFSTPLPLTWGFLRGRAQFWVSVVPEPRMIDYYRAEDRTLYRQVLRLPPAEARRAVALLHQADVREQTFYRYHHFRDNCTTRIRDLVDLSTAGRLRALSAAHPPQPPFTLRQHVLTGFAGAPALQALSELVLGRPADAPPSAWASMFLPDVLRAEVRLVYGAVPWVVHARQAGGLAPGPDAARGGRRALAALAVVLALLALVAAARPHGAWPRIARVVIGGVLGLLGLIVWGLAIASILPEFRYNEVLLVCWPTDGILPVLWARARAIYPGYLGLRLATLGGVALGSLAGVLIQPLAVPLLLTGLPLLALAVLARVEARRAASARSA